MHLLLQVLAQFHLVEYAWDLLVLVNAKLIEEALLQASCCTIVIACVVAAAILGKFISSFAFR